VLTRSIDLEPLGPPIEEKIARTVKRAIIAVAVAATTIAGLDLISDGGIKSAVAHVRNGGEINLAEINFAEWPDRIRTGINQISVLPDQPSIVLAIPRDAAPKFAAAPKNVDRPKLTQLPALSPTQAATIESSAVAGLAATRRSDAVEFAMAAPMSVPALASPPAPAAATVTSASNDALAPANLPPLNAPTSAPESVQLASLDPGALTGTPSSPIMLPTPAPIPLAMVPMPIPAPGVPPPSPAQRLKLDDKAYAKAEKCLANAIYWESRSEPLTGQEAVAQVVMNRVFSGFYPNDVCDVVYQNAHRHLACQFTFACDGKRKVINERGAWARANRIARQTLDGQIYVLAVAKSTHYHAIYVHPNWVREMRKMVRYGIHNFYRPYAWGNGNEEPVWGKAALAEMKKKK
jgi:hypothetical protein